MFKLSPTHRAKVAAVLVALVIALVLTSSGDVTASACKKVSGKYTLTPFSDPACLSPVGICATGVYKGDLNATSTFTGSSVIPTVDTPSTAVIVLTGDNVIQTSGGTLTTKDAIVLNSTGDGEFAEVDTVVAGTGEWAGASGRITASGTFTAVGGEGKYAGTVCTP